MTAEDKDQDVAALLERLLSSLQDEVPTSILGRFGRLAGTAARAGAGLGWSRLKGVAGLDARSAERLARSLGSLKGVAMKAGQIMSVVDDSLPLEARRILATLQTHSAHLPFAEIAGVVRAELGPKGEALVKRMEERPIAAASIGQVHRAVLESGEPVAVKVQYPGIEAAITSEFRAAGAGMTFARILMPGGRVEDFVAEARDRILAECDYAQELAWQQRFGKLFRRHRVLRVPAVHPRLSSRRVLTSGWEDGLRFDEWIGSDPSREDRDRIGETLYEFYLGTLLRHGLFNADPHPGNYLFRADGKLVMLDYGCVREFTPGEVAAFRALRDAVRHDSREAIRDALRMAGARDPGAGKLYDTTRTLLRAFFGPTLEDRVQPIPPMGQTGLGQLLSDKRSLAQLSLPGGFLFLFRIKFGLHAVLARIGAEANWGRLEDRFCAEADKASRT